MDYTLFLFIPLGALVVVFLVLFIIKIITGILNHDKQFSAFKRVQETKKMDIVSSILMPYPEYSKSVVFGSYILFVTRYGINLGMYIDYEGTISGKETDERLVVTNVSEETTVVNPFLEYNKLCSLIDEILKDKEVTKYIIMGTKCMFMINQGTYKVVKLNDLYYTFAKKANGKIYTVEEVDEIAYSIQKELK